MKHIILNWLSRKTYSNNFIPEIDGFRFFAIGTVVLYHLNTHFSRTIAGVNTTVIAQDNFFVEAISRGGLGVNVFFAISGFILALPFAKQRLFGAKPIKLADYYIRRITRLEPPYFISLLLLLLVHLIILKENFKDIFPSFLASLFYVHNILFDAWSKVNPVAWSLEVEVQFYVLAPAFAIIFNVRNSLWRRTLLIIVIVVGALNAQLNYQMIESLHLRKSLFMHLHQFLIGFLFADFFLTSWKETLMEKTYIYDLIGLSSLGLLYVFIPSNFITEVLFIGCLFLSFIALFKGIIINSFFTNKWIVIIGGMCYSIYLLHYALIALFSKYSVKLFFPSISYIENYLIQVVIVSPMVILVSALFFVLVERPCMNKDWPMHFFTKIKSILAD
ncbi:MAG: acyltransferase [Cyclobacteriaceae bacterium]|nr:acyltransferase [Cyclobacteriaceae bacterium]